MTPLISIIHPTARVKPSEAFPRGWRDAHDALLENCDHPEQVEYVVVVHESRLDEFLACELFADLGQGQWGNFKLAINRERDCVVDQLNVGARELSGDLIMGTMDDYFPPEHWDTAVLDALRIDGVGSLTADYWKRASIILHWSTGSPRDAELIVGGALTRKRYEQQGYLFHPAFESMFADDYYTWKAREDAKQGLCSVVQRFDIKFDHRHPSIAGASLDACDDVYKQQNRQQAYEQGYATFMKLAHATRPISVCLPGEKFDYRWVRNQFVLLNYINRGVRFLMIPIFGTSSNVHCIRIALAESILSAAIRSELVLWMDDDNHFAQLEHFDMLLADLDEHPELDGVVGWCWCDNDGEPNPDGSLKQWMISCGRQAADLTCKKLTQEDVTKAIASGKWLITSDDLAPDSFWSGFPCVLMRGSVLETLGARAFVPIVDERVKWGFMSEDASFFLRAAEAGLKFAVDLRVQLPHLKVRAIAPQYIPASEKQAALEAQGALPEPEAVAV